MDENNEETSSSSNNEERESELAAEISDQNQPLEQLPSTSRSTSFDQPRSEASRTRRLVSQSTFHEDELDSVELNSQRQFLDDWLESNESLSDNEEQNSSDGDELFDEYMRQGAESARIQATPFDDELPMVHSYLGDNMEDIRGTTIYEPGRVYEIPVCAHHSIVFPGEILPMIMISQSIFGRNSEDDGGLIFGLIFSEDPQKNRLYGVTCQVFEKGIDHQGHITVKSKAHQRFLVIKTDEGYTSVRNQNFYAKVKILPEYTLPDPTFLAITNNSSKFLHTPSYQQKLKSLLINSTQIPRWVFDKYSIISTEEKVERFLAMLKITAPEDPILKSFWLARNIPLNSQDRMKIFISNCVNKRMMIIGESLNFMCYFKCKRCKNKISIYADIFAMAKGNVNANYCNPAGYIHETLTVQKTLENSVRMVDRPSSEFSWFPGYAWQIAVCAICASHVGWKFIAVVKNLKPKSFFGLSNKSLIVSPENQQENSGEDEDENMTSESLNNLSSND